MADAAERVSRWCCDVFKGWFEASGERGLAIVVGRYEDGVPSFVMQHRSVDLDDEGPKTHPRPLTLVSQLHVQFCPWCGQRLRDIYGEASVNAMSRPELILKG